MNIFQSILFWKHQSTPSDFVFNKLVYGYGKWDVISHHAHLFKVNWFLHCAYGILEGVAEATAGLSKGYFESARMWRERESHLSNWAILLVRFQNPWWRCSFFRYGFSLLAPLTVLEKDFEPARDAMLSDEATPRTKGKIFGFHRSMDTLGAVLGPSLTLPLLLSWELYYLVLHSFPDFCYIRYPFVKRKKRTVPEKEATPLFSFWAIESKSSMYRKVVIGLLAFTYLTVWCFPAA
jgi:hypothetical protein